MISIIIPIYNRVNLLPRVLESIKNQTYKNLEIIIVDDGSGQEVKSQKSKVKSQFDNLLWIEQENRGAPSARNRGLEEAKGECVIFWDADIIGKPEMLEKLKKQLDNNPTASFSYCNYYLSFIFYFLLKKIPACKFDFKKLRENNFIHSTSLIRRKDVVKWDESLKRFQDWDLWLSMTESSSAKAMAGKEGKTGVWVDEYLFTILGGGTMSGWLPRIAYKVPFKWLPGISKRVREYEDAKKVVLKKHKISTITS